MYVKQKYFCSTDQKKCATGKSMTGLACRATATDVKFIGKCPRARPRE